ncbi:hypothetical protein KEM09_10075 [Carboxylicivirga mesophila]|uniref:Cache domain-containing protein n=1 Tax=Carboxylicivirga mesophila TaxID=1166478 RepID=A0ABS5KA45_9BACT|nr:hypothetical protein [Carboxylicivirga mesophila]MBS2211752.1 hypothetical protein [Carboxylicivirga mesophila]
MQKLTGKRFGILMTVSLVIILAMGLYYFHIQSVKEDKVKRQAFKMLYRYAGDLREKERDIETTGANSFNILKHDIDEVNAVKDSIKPLYQEMSEIEFDLEELYDTTFSVLYRYENRSYLIEKEEPLMLRYIVLDEQFEKYLAVLDELLPAMQYKIEREIKNRYNYNESNKEDYLFYDIDYLAEPSKVNYYEYEIDSILNDVIAPYLSQLPVHKDKIFPNVLDEADFFEGFIAFDSTEVVYNQFDYTHIELKQKKSKQSINIDTLMHLFNTSKKIELSLGGGSSDFSFENPYELSIPISLKGEDYQLFVVKVDGVNIHYLAGLIPKVKYASLKRGFDRALLTAITVFVLLLLFSIPVIKLFVVAAGEAYSIKNLITLVLSSVGLVFIMGYFILYETNLAYIKGHLKGDGEHLEQMSNGIRHDFNAELDSLLINITAVKDTLSNFVTSDSFKSFKRDSVTLHRIIAKTSFLTIDTLSWLDIFVAKDRERHIDPKRFEGKFIAMEMSDVIVSNDYGKILNITHNNCRYSDIDTMDGIDIRMRDYFNAPTLFTQNGTAFGMQSIFSLTTARPQVIFSSKIGKSSYLACIGTELTSVSNTILPHGYSFCVIDSKGKVWFHKDPENNVRENLFYETDQHPDLKAAILSHRKDVFKADYKMKPTLMWVEPLNVDLDLFIVTMCEVNNYAQIINHAGYIIIAAFILIVLFWFLCTWGYRMYKNFNSDIHNPPHSLLYFFPKKKIAEKYISLALHNSLLIVLWVVVVMLFFRRIYVIHWISLLALIGAGSLLAQMRFLCGKGACKITFKLFIYYAIFSVALLSLVELMMPKTCFMSYSFIGSVFILTTFNGLLFVSFKNNGTRLKAIKDKVAAVLRKKVSVLNTFRIKYYLYVYTLLLLFAFMPLVVLYTVVYQQETTLHYMAQQRYVAEQILERRELLLEQNNRKSTIKPLERKGNYYEQLHHMKFDTLVDEQGDNNIESCNFRLDQLKGTFNYVHVFGQARANMFFLNNLIEDRGNRVKPSYINSDDTLKQYTYFISGDSLNLQVKTGGFPHNDQLFVMRMDKPGLWHITKRYLGIVYGFLVISVLYFMYLPTMANRYLFPGFKYAKTMFTEKQSKTQLHELEKGENKYIVTMPDKAFYRKCIENEHTKMYRLHLPQSLISLLRDNNANKHVYLFIDHMSFKGVSQLQTFVEYLENVLETEQFLSFNIVCFKMPRILIQHFRDSLISELRKNNKKTAKKRMQLDTILKRLVNCLAYFSMTYVPITRQPLKEDVLEQIGALKQEWEDEFRPERSITGDTYKQQWKKHISWIDDEIGKNAALVDKYQLFRRQDTLSENDYKWGNEETEEIKNKVVNEDNVLQAYLINRTYYQKIWDSCDNEEKSILYDIADDYVINLHKKGVINILINKGLIKNGQFLKLFNLSFTLFVTRQENEVDAINASLREHSKAGWSQYGLPLKLLGVAIIVFLVVTQQEFLTGIQSILISIGAILTFALRFFNFPLRSGS